MMYTVRQTANMLGVSEETVRRWIREGKLKSIEKSKKGKTINIDKNELIRFSLNEKRRHLKPIINDVPVLVYQSLIQDAKLELESVSTQIEYLTKRKSDLEKLIAKWG